MQTHLSATPRPRAQHSLIILFRLYAVAAALICAAFNTTTLAQTQESEGVVTFDGLSRPATSISALTPTVVPATGTSGIAGPYPVSLAVAGVPWTIGRIAVRVNNISHTNPGNLDVLLVSPTGQKVMLMSDVGGSHDLEHATLTFQFGAPTLPADAQIVSGTYAPTDLEPGESLPAPAPAAPYAASLIDFEGTSPNGTWQLFVADDADEDVGSIYGFTLIVTPRFDNTTPAPVPPTGTVGLTESLLPVSGLTAPITKVAVSLSLLHTDDSDLNISLVGPDGTTVTLAANNGGSGDNFGSDCRISGRSYFDDAGSISVTEGSAPFVLANRPITPLAAFNGKSGAASNGTWRLRVNDEDLLEKGTLQCWSLYITQNESVLVQPPTALTATLVAGNQVTLRWVAPGAGPTPTGYVLEGGLAPGETIASLPTGGTSPILTFTAPTGAFFVRLRAQAGAALSDPSNEIPLFVNVPALPSAPTQLLGVRNGSSLGLAWRNTFVGGAPAALILDVIGSAVASIPLPLTESVSFPGIPAGAYILQLRAANAAGAGPPSQPLTLSFPSACGKAPEKPFDFLAYKVGNTLHAVWEPNASGEAATGYIIDVTGSFAGRFPLTDRSVSGTVGPGTYNVSVAASNSCGASAFTTVQSVTIP